MRNGKSNPVLGEEIELMLCLDGVTCNQCEDKDCNPLKCKHFCHDLSFKQAKKLGAD